MSVLGNSENCVIEILEILCLLKGLVKELNVLVIVLL